MEEYTVVCVCVCGGGGGGGLGLLPIMAYTGRHRPKGVPFQASDISLLYKRVWNSDDEVYKRVGKSVISVCKKPQKG